MLIKSSLKILKIKEELYKVELKSIIILIVGEVTLHSFIKLFQLGSLKSLTSKKIWSRTTIKLLGCLKSFNKKDSTTGLKMPKIGVSQETDIGETLFHFGFLKMDKKSCVLDQLSNWRN